MMSGPGRGRGYSGRHHARQEPRPGEASEDIEAIRTLTELSPRSPDPLLKNEIKNELKRDELPIKDDKHPVRYDDEAVLKELLTVDEQFRPLVALLEQFSPGEDGIQFNRKLRQFESSLSMVCPDEARLIQAFATFRAVSLANGNTARKLASVGASFTRQQNQQLFRVVLLNVVMQGSYAKLDVLQRSNTQYLINAANLIGDYFAEARLVNGEKMNILAAPLLHYMRALLMSDDIKAHKSMATQLMQNGRDLLPLLTQEMDELSIAIRKRLLSPPPVSIVWLLLSADLCINKFNPLPNTLQHFYASHLDLNNTDDSYNEVTYGTWKDDKLAQDVNLNLSIEEKPKLRPILGAGAGVKEEYVPKPLSKRYDLNSWRENEPECSEPVNSDVKPVENWRKEVRKVSEPKRSASDVPRSHKYWDHDDRCDIDYNS